MKKYNVTIGESLRLLYMTFRVEAKNKKEAIKKVKTLGFNCGETLSSGYTGEFKPIYIDEIKEGFEE